MHQSHKEWCFLVEIGLKVVLDFKQMGKKYNYAFKLLCCYVAILLSFCVLRFAFCVPNAFAQVPQPWSVLSPNRCTRIEDVAGMKVEVATIQGLECVFINILRILTPLVGLIMFVMLIVGSFQFLTAGGDPKQAQRARATLTYAIAGLVLFLGIWFILLFIKAVTGVDVTKFVIPGP